MATKIFDILERTGPNLQPAQVDPNGGGGSSPLLDEMLEEEIFYAIHGNATGVIDIVSPILFFNTLLIFCEIHWNTNSY